MSLTERAKQEALRREEERRADRERQQAERKAKEAEERDRLLLPMLKALEEMFGDAYAWAPLSWHQSARWAVFMAITEPHIRLHVTSDGTVTIAREVKNRLGSPFESSGVRILGLADLGDWLLDQERERRYASASATVDG